MKLKYFYKIDQHNKQPIAGSNIRRKSSPGKLWKELIPHCCLNTVVSPTNEMRYFVQLDHNGKPIDGSLIKRNGYPEMSTGIHYQELPWKGACCLATITWSFERLDLVGLGSLAILVNGIQVLSTSDFESGSFTVEKGDTVEVVSTANPFCGMSSEITGSTVDSYGTGNGSFVVTGNTDIATTVRHLDR